MWRRFLVVGLIGSASTLVSAVDDTTGPQTKAGQSPTLSFCQQRFYEVDDGRLLCNWAVNFNFACFVSYPSNKVIQEGAKISDPEVIGECDNGEPVIKLFHY